MSPVPETDSPGPLPSTPEGMKEKFKEILKSNGITDEVSEVVLEDAGLQGENFASQTSCITVKFANPALKPLNLFVKTVTTNKSHTDFLEDVKFFAKETLFFSKYIPAVRTFLQAKGQEKLLEIYPKCYYGDNEVVVFENLVLDRGFQLEDKVKKQDFEAASIALATLAKHHAISYAYIKEVGGVDEFVKKFPNIEFESFAHVENLYKDAIEDAIKTNVQILKNSSAEGKEEAIAALEEKLGTSWKFIMDNLKSDPEDPLLLLNHGDYWNNNMLFRRCKDTGKIVELIIIDLQATRIDSPGGDFGYYLFSSVKPEVRNSRIKELLTCYLNALNETTAKLDHPINLTYDELYQNYRKRFEFGFWIIGVSVATQACYSVLKDIDVSTVDMNEFTAVYNKLVDKWIEDNPEQCEIDAKEMVMMMREYKALSLK